MDLEHVFTRVSQVTSQNTVVELRRQQVMPDLHVEVGVLSSVRVHLDPPVQAAGEHHPTDLKTGSVRSKETTQSPQRTAGSRECY